VRREHDPRPRAGREDPLLTRRSEPRIERQDLVTSRTRLLQLALRVADPALAGQEHEHVARAAPADRLEIDGRELRRRRGHRLRQVDPALERPVAHVDRIRAALDPDDRRAAEVRGEALGVDRRGRDDDLEVRAPAPEPLQVTEQEVDVEAALVRLVDDQRVVRIEPAIPADLVEQDAVRHHLDQRRRVRLVGETDLPAYRAADLDAELVRETLRDGPRGDAPRLRVADHRADAAAGLEAEPRELRRLAAAGIAADADHAVARQRVEDPLARLRDGQLLRVVEAEPGRAPLLRAGLRLLETRVELLDEPGRGPPAPLALLDGAEQRAQVGPAVARAVRRPCLAI